MKAEEIHIMDIGRILMGEVPGSFLIEVIIRTVFLFLLLLFSMRLMGRRMASTLNRNELAALVALAAAIGVPLQSPDKGLLPAFIIAIIIIAFQQLIARRSVASKGFEKITQSNYSILVANGQLNLHNMKLVGLSRERIYAELRSARIDNLGQVERLYLEASGQFNVLKFETPRQGESIIPEWDQDFYHNS
jgi:uncharacterized membrane protein YcaP (DUF421 family)